MVDIFFFTTWKKGEWNGFIFQQEDTHITFDIIFIVCTLIDNSYEPISVWEFRV